MRRRNRRRTTHALLMPAPAAGVIVMLVTLAMVYLWLDHSCTALGQQIKALEQRVGGLRNELARESNKWTQLKAPARLDHALLRHGIAMQLALPEQVVHVRAAPDARFRPREEWARAETQP